MELKAVTFSAAEGVGLLTLNRPDRLNAWTHRMETEVRWCMRQADADAAVRAVVVTGAGRGFCAGGDARALGGYAGGSDYVATSEEATTAFAYLLDLSIPVIAAVNGPAAGVGLVLACFCDIRFAAAGAKLTTSFGRIGLPAEHGIAWLLPRLVGAAHAADLLLSSRVVLAEEAAGMGLVNRVLPGDRLLAEALAYARALATEVAPSSLAAIKRQLWAEESLAEAIGRAESLTATMITAPEFQEGVAALAEKRPPRF